MSPNPPKIIRPAEAVSGTVVDQEKVGVIAIERHWMVELGLLYFVSARGIFFYIIIISIPNMAVIILTDPPAATANTITASDADGAL